MWMWIIIGLNTVVKVHGYASAPFPESCSSMVPHHVRSETGAVIQPQTSEPPFYIYYNHGKQGAPITVFLSSTPDKFFRGFLLEAREQGRVDRGHPVGKFILLEPDNTQLLTCDGMPGSAVIQRSNRRKTSIKVNWTAQGEDPNVTFRATFVESFAIFWEPVDVNVTFPTLSTSTTKPSTAASTTKLSTAESTTKSSTTASTTKPSTAESTTKLSTAESTTKSSTAANTSKSSTTASTTKPSTAASTTKSSTAASTTKSSTTASTTKLSTAESTTKSSTAASTTKSSTTASTTKSSTAASTTKSSTTASTTKLSTAESTTKSSTAANTSKSSTTASTTKPSTAASTTKSSTAASTTKSSTTASTTKLSTAESTTKSSTAESTRKPSMTTLSPITNTTTGSSLNNTEYFNKLKAAGVAVMSFDSLIVVLNMELSMMFTTFSTSSSSHHVKGLKISCSVLCAAVEISTLVLFCVGEFSKVTLTAFVIVTIVINFLELLIASLPFGPSHELKEICNLAAMVCSVIHEIFTIAVMFIGVLEVDKNRKNRKQSWLVTVIAAYTAWMFLSVFWVFLFSMCSQAKLGRSKTGSVREGLRRQRKKEKTNAAEVIGSAVSVILIVGTMAFTVAIVYGIFECQGNLHF